MMSGIFVIVAIVISGIGTVSENWMLFPLAGILAAASIAFAILEKS